MKPRETLAWAVVGKKSGKPLKDMFGQYGAYTHRKTAEGDCPSYGTVERVRIVVVKSQEK